MCLETISYRVPQLWNLVATDIKDTLSLSTFKEKLSHGNVTIGHVVYAKHTLSV